jgi:Tfp pilus assembly protein PilF
MSTTSNAVLETFENLYGRGTELLRPLIVEARSISQDHLLQGIDCVERAIKIDPRSWPASWVLGRAYTIVGDLERAHRMFRLAYQLNPSDKNVGRELGLSLLRLGCSQLGLLVFDKLVSKFADDHTLIANLALCHWMSGDANRGFELVERALSLDKNETSLELRRRIIETVEQGTPAPSRLIG